jgi:hypothetical protein
MSISTWKSEAQFQASCVAWFDKEYPSQRGRLIGIFNNPKNASQLISMGLRPGISDLLYFPPQPKEVHVSLMPLLLKVVWIELKIGYNKQSESQTKWEALSKSFGHQYHVVTEYLSSFQSLINLYNQ